MQEVTYFTCLKMMSETMAKMPWKLFQKTDKGIIEPELTEAGRLMRVRPNPLMTPTTFWNTVEMNRCHFGNAYVYIRRRFRRKKYGGQLSVVLCVLIHVAAFVYAAVAMWEFMDMSALPTIISESSEVLRTCVFGYMIKAGLENWQKIRNSKSSAEGQNENETEEPKG